ncbi:MAG: hypothetical protein II180_13055 [Proteobacteria bacterium]|nr:hypothetical protein [Pseudomonadota bacterium]
MAQAVREYKDRLFTFIFGSEENREWTLSLYNAVNDSHYTDASAIEITTIKEVIYLGMHNDVSFIIANELNLYEQQASYNPNMPLRQLQYLGNLYEAYVEKNDFDKYGRKLIPLPVPRFMVFYNGLDKVAEDSILRLSDAFPPGANADVEVRVRMLDINYGKNQALLEKCKPLMEYAWIVREIRERAKKADIKTAVDSVIDDLPDSFVLKLFLVVHKLEVGTMLLTEYDEVKHYERVYRDAHREGKDEGKAEGKAEGIMNMMQALKLSFEQAASVMKIPDEEFPLYKKMIAELGQK